MAVAVAAAVAVAVAAAVAVAVVVIAVAVAVAISIISTMSFFFQAIISSHTTVIFCSPYARYGIRALARDCSADDGARGD